MTSHRLSKQQIFEKVWKYPQAGLEYSDKSTIVKFVQINPTSYQLCTGCDKLIHKAYPVCPYCKSYRFYELDSYFIDNLQDSSEQIDYINRFI